MDLNNYFCISPIDGRYRNITADISKFFSEYAYIKYRIKIEIEWLKYILTSEIFGYNVKNVDSIDEIYTKFNLEECIKVKDYEKITNHDVKAIEYYVREKLEKTKFSKYVFLVHFACTSEDINNLAQSLMIKDCLSQIIIPSVSELIQNVNNKAIEYKNVAMLGHTHGQAATPTTVGKELAIYVYRWKYILDKILSINLKGKFSGAVGNFAAHKIVYDIDWINISKEFINSLGIEFNPLCAQIESHDTMCELFSYFKLFNNITLDFNSDMWMYISMGYFKQRKIDTETGSSVMPHKVNPINHENSMANIHMSNSIIDNFTNNLQISRMQRDLSDSSNLRNIGVMLAHMLISVKQTIIAFNKMEPNFDILNKDLEENPEVIAEAIQTMLRKNGYNNAYEILKDFTRGKKVTLQELKAFINTLEINDNDKETLLKLEPNNYVGLSSELVDYFNNI